MDSIVQKKQAGLGKFKTEIIALAILVPLVVVLGLVVTRFPAKQIQAVATASPTIKATVLPVEETAAPTSVSAVAPGAFLAPKLSTVSLQLVAPGQKQMAFEVAYTQGMHVADVLVAAQSQGLVLITKEYGGSMGLFVEAMNGIKNNVTTDLYWQFYVNGKKSSVGASSAAVASGDIITWKYERQDD